jgi:hypothetical protein
VVPALVSPARKDVVMSESPRAKRDDSIRAGIVLCARVPNIPFLIRQKNMPAKVRKRTAPAMGADRWIVSRNPPDDVFRMTALVVSGTGVAEVTGESGEDTAGDETA